MKEHLAALRDLMVAIQQDDAGRWYVSGEDPELTCCEAANALDALEADAGRATLKHGLGQAVTAMVSETDAATADIIRSAQEGGS